MRVFQDHACGTSVKPWERDLTDRTRWTNPVRTAAGCAVRSPSVSLTWLRVDAPVNFDGGVALVLNADESGIAASILVEAAWPAYDRTVAAVTDPEADSLVARPSPDPITPNRITPGATAPLANPGATAPLENPGATAPLANRNSEAPINRKLELSGNIAGQAIVPDGQRDFVVDSMDDPTRMRYGYRQTSGLLRALKRAAALKFRLTLRSPEVTVISGSLELSGLDAAVRALNTCAER